MDKTSKLSRKSSRGKTCKGFMHDRDRTDLLLRKLVWSFEVVDLDLPLVCSLSNIFCLYVTGRNCSE